LPELERCPVPLVQYQGRRRVPRVSGEFWAHGLIPVEAAGRYSRSLAIAVGSHLATDLAAARVAHSFARVLLAVLHGLRLRTEFQILSPGGPCLGPDNPGCFSPSKGLIRVVVPRTGSVCSFSRTRPYPRYLFVQSLEGAHPERPGGRVRHAATILDRWSRFVLMTAVISLLEIKNAQPLEYRYLRTTENGSFFW